MTPIIIFNDDVLEWVLLLNILALLAFRGLCRYFLDAS